MKGKRVVLVGIDGGTWRILFPWIKRNKLPTFKKIIGKGCWGTLKSTIPSITPVALPTFFTGKNPGKTGFFGFTKRGGRLVCFSDLSDKAFWELYSDIKVCVVNLRLTFPPRKLNGVMISGSVVLQTNATYTYPRELQDEFSSFHEKDDEIFRLATNLRKNKEKLVNLLIDITRKKYKDFKRLSLKDKYNLLIFYIANSDLIQHWFWDDLKILLKFYKAVDGIIDDVLYTYPDANILLFSDHGFEKAPTIGFNLNSWLVEEGYLNTSFLTKIIGILGRLVTSSFSISKVADISKRLLPLKISSRITRFPIDFHNISSKNNILAYLGSPYGINIVCKNKEKYEKVREKLVNKLKTLTHDGVRVIREVYKREEVFSGPFLNNIPDIVFVLNEGYKVLPFASDKIFHRIISQRRNSIAGVHDNARDGIFMAIGPDIKKGFIVSMINIQDIAPTIFHIFGLPIPSDVDGRVLTEIFEFQSEIAKRTPTYVDTSYYKTKLLKEKTKEKIKELKLLRKTNRFKQSK
jgi:predicted AlkP superfamily phosphohydrolase/phosphomutase